MPMKLNYRPNETLPPLAWLCLVNAASNECIVHHGQLVETRSNYFVEGAWNGPFTDGNLDSVDAFFGSGACLSKGDGLVFVPSTATVDYLYYAFRPQAVLVSNSLSFLLAELDDQLIDSDYRYIRINDSIRKGFKNYIREIPTRHNNVFRLLHNNLCISKLGVSEVSKPMCPEFHSFDEYAGYLELSLRLIISNARDTARVHPLKVLSTQSSGYDSTAVNAIASTFGVDLALTVSEAKERYGLYRKGSRNYRSDSGAEVCDRLTIPVKLIDRRYFETEPQYEFLYWACMHNSLDMNLQSVRLFSEGGAVLLTGVLGEIWYNRQSTPKKWMDTIDDNLQRWDNSCHGLSEARLHFGYIHVAVPFIGARRREQIYSISNSDEMRNWSIGGVYDRPIPRRIAEERGVDRRLFGQKKFATTITSLPPYLPFCSDLRSKFFIYCKAHMPAGWISPSVLRFYLNCNVILYYSFKIFERVYNKGADFIVRLGVLSTVTWFPEPWFIGRSTHAALYSFCVNLLAENYRRWQGGQTDAKLPSSRDHV